jgi:hypothetical protein
MQIITAQIFTTENILLTVALFAFWGGMFALLGWHLFFSKKQHTEPPKDK